MRSVELEAPEGVRLREIGGATYRLEMPRRMEAMLRAKRATVLGRRVGMVRPKRIDGRRQFGVIAWRYVTAKREK